MAPTDPLCPSPAPAVTRGRPIPGRPSDGITRRRLLALASSAIVAGILAACGEEERAELAGVALPVVAVPRIVIVNRALAASREVKLPPADRLAFDRDAFFELARRLNAAPGDDGNGGTPGLLMRVNPDADPATQMFTAPPLTPYAHVFLASAVGGIGSPDGSYEGLRTESAVRAVEDLQAMVNDLGYALPGEEFLRNLRAQNFGMFVAGFGGAKPAEFDSAIYPFPDFGSGRNPARIDWLAGVAATNGDPAAAYRAVTPIASGLAQVTRFPALRTSAEELQILYRDLTIEEAELMVDLLEHAALIGIDRRDWPVLIGQIDAGAVLGGLDPAETLNRAADELAALRRG